jgi:hypothetical protein
MTNGSLRVKTTRSASGWGYAVVNGVGQTLAARRGYPTDNAARAAGRAAADALAPVAQPSRYTYLAEANDASKTDLINGWRTLFR